MKANELRIGNYVLHRGKIKATNIEIIDDARVVSEILVEEIPITEEWLVKFGFKWHSKSTTHTGYGLIKEQNLSFSCYPNNDNRVFFQIGKEPKIGENCCIYNVNYVHQLQNLYFALTGQELTIK